MDMRRALIERIIPFLEETKNHTAGTDFERWLNANCGPGTSFYEDAPFEPGSRKVVPIDPGALLKGPNGWSGPGWTAPGPGSAHYPESRNGALISLVFLLAGRVAHDIKPPTELPRR
jgi:hypothetical protein